MTSERDSERYWLFQDTVKILSANFSLTLIFAFLRPPPPRSLVSSGALKPDGRHDGNDSYASAVQLSHYDHTLNILAYLDEPSCSIGLVL